MWDMKLRNSLSYIVLACTVSSVEMMDQPVRETPTFVTDKYYGIKLIDKVEVYRKNTLGLEPIV